MKTECKLNDYSDLNPVREDRVIVREAFAALRNVVITIGSESAEVDGDELKRAIDACQR